MSRIVDVENAPIIFNEDGVIGKLLLEQENSKYLFLTFEPNSQTEAHVQDILMAFYVVNGKAKVIVNNEPFELKSGQLIEIAAGKTRQWINCGDGMLELFVVKSQPSE